MYGSDYLVELLVFILILSVFAVGIRKLAKSDSDNLKKAKENEEKYRNIFENNIDKIDLLITDVIMPQMNGRELFEQLATRESDLPVIFISGYPANVISKYEVLDEGIDFIQKPINIEELLKKIQILLKNRSIT